MGANPTLERLKRFDLRPTKRFGQNFLVDKNTLGIIVEESGAGSQDVVVEVGGGVGTLSEALAPHVKKLFVFEIDARLKPALEDATASQGNCELIYADYLTAELEQLKPSPTRLVANLPYSIAIPAVMRTLTELASVRELFVMVQLELAQRLAAKPGSKAYSGSSVIAQLYCEVELVRRVPATVFLPKPKVESALVRLRRRGSEVEPELREFVHAAFAHRRKALARSVEMYLNANPALLPYLGSGGGPRLACQQALKKLGHDSGVRAEALTPLELAQLFNIVTLDD